MGLARRPTPRRTPRARALRTGLAASACVLAFGLAGSLGALGATGGGIEPQASVQLDEGLCQTTGGGAFVPIPGFPGESIDTRLLADIRWMVERYKIFITDGYATSGHAPNGEHPIGLALDIVPNKAAGGKWRKITKLARWAEPTQNDPRPPFRWVGYNGDPNHGRGNHLHLSWMHSATKPKQPAEVVYTRFCPDDSPARASRRQAERILGSLPYAGPHHDDRRR